MSVHQGLISAPSLITFTFILPILLNSGILKIEKEQHIYSKFYVPQCDWGMERSD